MGGYGSGRPATRITVESALRLDLASPAVRTVIKQGAISSGTWTWSRDGEPYAKISYQANLEHDDDARLILNFAVSGQPACQFIRLVQSRPHYGGHRWWFLCPLLEDDGRSQTVRALFLPPGKRHFGSRQAHGLNYQSQKDSRSLTKFVGRLLAEYA